MLLRGKPSTILPRQEEGAAGHLPPQGIGSEVQGSLEQDVGFWLLGVRRLRDQRRGERGQQHQQ